MRREFWRIGWILAGLFAGLSLASCGNKERTIAADGGVTLREVTVGSSIYAVAEVDLAHADLRLFWKRADGERYGSFAALAEVEKQAEKRVVFATNAGIFNKSFVPLGLHVEAGERAVDINLAEGLGNFYMKPNGVFSVSDDGAAAIVEAAKFGGQTDRLRLATQSGPLLLMGGTIHPAFQANSENRRIRGGVGIVERGRVVLVLSKTPVTFYEMAVTMRDRLHCADALYLDGEISKFYAPKAGWSEGAGDFAGMLAVVADGS